MLGQSILNNLFDRLVGTGIVKEVFHSVLVRDVEGRKKPVAPVGKEFRYVGVDDTQGFTCYCRVNGTMDLEQEERIGSCEARIVSSRIPHKLVFFNDNEGRDHDEITGKLIQAVIGAPGIRLIRTFTIPEQILQTESNGAFTFTTSTYYTSIEFSLLLKLQAENCSNEFGCSGLKNPYK